MANCFYIESLTTNIEKYTLNTSCTKWEYTKWGGWLPRSMISIQNDITLNPPYTKWDG